MTARLGHTPAEKTPSSTLNFKFVDKLFADKGFSIDPQAETEARIRAAVPPPSPLVQDMIAAAVARARTRIAEGDEQAEGAQVRPRRGRLGSGGATVPRSGIGVPPLPRQAENSNALTGSSSVSRWALLHKIQKISRPADPDARGPAVCGCGMPGHDATAINIHLRTSETTGEIRAGVSGIYRCGSPWLCPTCAVAKAHDRAERVQSAANATFQRGGRAALVVLTASHSRDMSLAEIKSLVATSSSAARKGRAWMNAVEEYDILGVVVGQEVTFSTVNGWHYHQHLSVMVDGPNDDAYDRAEAAGAWIAAAYAVQVRARGGTISDRYGWHVRVARDAADASDYTAKGSMAWEVAGAHKDRTKAETSLTPWDIAVAAADGDKAMFARWREYMETMPGTRSCVVSSSLAKKLGIAAGGDTEDAGEQVLHDADEVVGRVEAPTWRVWMRHGLAATFLSRVEFGGEEGFDAAVAATDRDAAPLEAEYQRLRVQRAALRKAEIERKAQTIETERQAKRVDRDTAFAKAWAIDRLRRFADDFGTRERIARVITEAAGVFPSAAPLNAADLVKAAA